LPGTALYRLCEQQGCLSAPVLPGARTGIGGETFERTMIATDQFTPQTLAGWLSAFNRKAQAVIVCTTLLWLVTHLDAWGGVLRKVKAYTSLGPRIAIKRLFFGGLFFKWNFTRIKT
jgi:hypothetical protein